MYFFCIFCWESRGYPAIKAKVEKKPKMKENGKHLFLFLVFIVSCYRVFCFAALRRRRPLPKNVRSLSEKWNGAFGSCFELDWILHISVNFLFVNFRFGFWKCLVVGKAKIKVKMASEHNIRKKNKEGGILWKYLVTKLCLPLFSLDQPPEIFRNQTENLHQTESLRFMWILPCRRKSVLRQEQARTMSSTYLTTLAGLLWPVAPIKSFVWNLAKKLLNLTFERKTRVRCHPPLVLLWKIRFASFCAKFHQKGKKTMTGYGVLMIH